MNKLRQILVLASLVCILSGCDMFRKMVGRPTSEDIEAKRMLIDQEQKSHQKRLDSLKLIQKQISDSLETLDYIRNSKNVSLSTRQLSEDSRSDLEYRYYVIVGAFGKRENAEKLAAKAAQEGVQGTLIGFKNGFTAVGVCPSNNITEAFASLGPLRQKSFCPADAWILDNH